MLRDISADITMLFKTQRDGAVAKCAKIPINKTSATFLGAHAAAYNLFYLGRQLISADHYRSLRQVAFASWKKAVMI